jgi:hypothetical protein
LILYDERGTLGKPSRRKAPQRAERNRVHIGLLSPLRSPSRERQRGTLCVSEDAAGERDLGMTAAAGFLAIWSDVEAREETNYLHWLTREHTAERVSIAGFLNVRVFRARLLEHCRYFVLYRLEQASVVGSEPYLARLNAPTDWSQRIMPMLQNFVRGGGHVVAEAGCGEGALVIPIVCERPEIAAAGAMLGPLAALDRVVSARLFEVEQGGTDIATNEKSMRTNDRSFPALLLVEALCDAALDAALDALRETVRMPAPPTRYEQVFALDRNEIVHAPGT